MSVYTSISDNKFSEILENYSLGNFIRAQGIQSGIENTNYFVTTTTGEYVFTLFEKITKHELESYILLLQELSVAGIACPQLQKNLNKKIIGEINNKPYTFVNRLKGKNLTSANTAQCKTIAIELAKLHIVPLSNLSGNILFRNRYDKIWRNSTAKNLLDKLTDDDVKLLSDELKIYQNFDNSKLPKGIIHADLFKDNALFENNSLSGIIDFYDACYDTYLYDIAITINAWCINQNCTNNEGKLNASLVEAFLNGYQSVRTLTDDEKKAWPIMLRIAATRFWLSRLENTLIPVPTTKESGVLTQSKDPVEYKQILQNHIKEPIISSTFL